MKSSTTVSRDAGRAPKEMCKERIRGTWHDSACTRKAVRDGYCTIHHSDAVQARRAKTEERWKENERIRTEQRNATARKTVWAFLDHVAGQLAPQVQNHLLAALEKWEYES